MCCVGGKKCLRPNKRIKRQGPTVRKDYRVSEGWWESASAGCGPMKRAEQEVHFNLAGDWHVEKVESEEVAGRHAGLPADFANGMARGRGGARWLGWRWGDVNAACVGG